MPLADDYGADVQEIRDNPSTALDRIIKLDRELAAAHRSNAELIQSSVEISKLSAKRLSACKKIQAALKRYGSAIHDMFGHDEQFLKAMRAVDAVVKGGK